MEPMPNRFLTVSMVTPKPPTAEEITPPTSTQRSAQNCSGVSMRSRRTSARTSSTATVMASMTFAHVSAGTEGTRRPTASSGMRPSASTKATRGRAMTRANPATAMRSATKYTGLPASSVTPKTAANPSSQAACDIVTRAGAVAVTVATLIEPAPPVPVAPRPLRSASR